MKTPFWKLKAFYVAAVGLVYVVVKHYLPDIPLSQDDLFGMVVFIVGLFGVQLEAALHAQGFFNGS